MKKIIKFVGIPSMDEGHFCFEVDQSTLKEMTGDSPTQYRKSWKRNLFRIYPEEFLFLKEEYEERELEITIVIKEKTCK